MPPCADQTPGAKFVSTLIAVNAALPLLLAAALDLIPGQWPRLIPFLLCVFTIFALNHRICIAMPRFRWWIRGLSAANLTATFLLGNIALINSAETLYVILHQRLPF